MVVKERFGKSQNDGRGMRGGWTWYTGSAGWMYRLLIETLLGLNLEGDHLRLTPRLPRSWKAYTIHYRYRQTVYRITITRVAEDSAKPNRLSLDGKDLSSETVPLVDDHREHTVGLTVWSPTRTAPEGSLG